MKILLLALVLALSAATPSRAFLGDDEATIARRYGEPLGRDDDEGYVRYHSRDWEIAVTFQDGHSVAERFRRWGPDRTFSPAMVQALLRGHAAGRDWRQTLNGNGLQRWERDGASALFADDPDSATFIIQFQRSVNGPEGMSIAPDTFGSPSPAPAATKTVAVIEGNGNRSSEPFTITKPGGFTVEYASDLGPLTLKIYRQGEKTYLAKASLQEHGEHRTVVAAGPGTYSIEIVATGRYKVTVRE